jgi:fumarate reductase flavoprotein subunit
MSLVIDQKNCTCCHRCRVECPQQAITFRNSKYWINPEKCTSCGHCVEVCHNACISDPDHPAAPPVPHEKKNLSCDVVVIGGGAAGTAAAARAAANGAKVIILEKGHEIGGSAWYAHMFRVHYSKWHKDAGFADRRDKIYAQFMERTEGKVDGALLHRLLDVNSELVDWLITEHNLGQDFTFGKGPFGGMGLVSTYQEPYNAERIDTTIGPCGNGWYLCRKMLQICEDNGGQILYHTAAKELLLNEDGSLRGVLADDPGGEVEIECKAAVIAAGAFSRNKKIMDKMQPLFYDDEGQEPVHVFTCSRSTGDGIEMCEKIGADIDYVNRRVNLFGPARHPYPCCSLSISRGFGGVMFNSLGEPYHDPHEMTEISELVHQPGRYCWVVLDDAIAEAGIQDEMKKEKDVANIDLPKTLVRWREFLKEEEECGSVVSANTLEELAEKINFPDPEKFKSYILEDNEKPQEPFHMPPPIDDESPNPMFHMPDKMPVGKAPFYAMKLKLFHENAMGGMTIDQNTNVLKDGKPIQGLYAAGDNTRGIMLPGKIGVQYIEEVISALTYAFDSGYIAGIEAAKFVQ